MQLVILVYQVTGASKVLPIYMLVRALVSAYLFLTGYGHFYYTWKTGDTGLVRYFRVIFRLNFLTVVLCLTMNRPYQFYSFIPLVSFWYTLVSNYVNFAGLLVFGTGICSFSPFKAEHTSPNNCSKEKVSRFGP